MKNTIRDNIDKLLSKKKRLLAYATAITLATASLTGCGELQDLNYKVTQEQSKDKHSKKEKPKKMVSYDEIANLHSIEIYNGKSREYEQHLCRKEKYFYSNDKDHEEPGYKFVDNETNKDIVLGMNEHSVWRKASHDSYFVQFCDDSSRTNYCQSKGYPYHHLGSAYTLDGTGGGTNLYYHGQVKELLHDEDKKEKYTEEEYKNLKNITRVRYYEQWNKGSKVKTKTISYGTKTNR